MNIYIQTQLAPQLSCPVGAPIINQNAEIHAFRGFRNCREQRLLGIVGRKHDGYLFAIQHITRKCNAEYSSIMTAHLEFGHINGYRFCQPASVLDRLNIGSQKRMV
jgi:hypothetical protein